jgi:hypothetical protein
MTNVSGRELLIRPLIAPTGRRWPSGEDQTPSSDPLSGGMSF